MSKKIIRRKGTIAGWVKEPVYDKNEKLKAFVLQTKEFYIDPENGAPQDLFLNVSTSYDNDYYFEDNELVSVNGIQVITKKDDEYKVDIFASKITRLDHEYKVKQNITVEGYISHVEGDDVQLALPSYIVKQEGLAQTYDDDVYDEAFIDLVIPEKYLKNNVIALNDLMELKLEILFNDQNFIGFVEEIINHEKGLHEN